MQLTIVKAAASSCLSVCLSYHCYWSLESDIFPRTMDGKGMEKMKWFVCCALCLMLGSLARANSITFTLNDEFSPGNKAPAPGTAGYMTAQFVENGSGGLNLTLDASHLLP